MLILGIHPPYFLVSRPDDSHAIEVIPISVPTQAEAEVVKQSKTEDYLGVFINPDIVIEAEDFATKD